ncbi:hypothetical protein ABW20_dc0107715 [Dactylellina cionopaga]|nr:hypothetical protein ABW20_dc0107715 [Dactylellina cionopaga]
MDDSAVSFLNSAKYPWEWSAQEVVDYLERRTTLRYYFGDSALKAKFLDNEITGAVLLDESFTRDTLKVDLGIKIGISLAIWNIVRALRELYPEIPSVDLRDPTLLRPPPEEEYEDEHDAQGEFFQREESEIEDVERVPETTILHFGPLDPVNVPPGGQTIFPAFQFTSSVRAVPANSTLISRDPHPIFQIQREDENSQHSNSYTYDIPTPQSAISVDENEKRSIFQEEDDVENDDMHMTPRPFSGIETPVEEELSLGSTGMDLSFISDVEEMIQELDIVSSAPATPDHQIVASDLSGFEEIHPIELIQHTPEPITEDDSEIQLLETPKRQTPKSPPLPRPPRRRKLHPFKPRTFLDLVPLTALDITRVVKDPYDTDEFVIRGNKAPPGVKQGANNLMTHFFLKKATSEVEINGELHTAYCPQSVRNLNRYQRNPITIINARKVKIGEDIKEHIRHFPSLNAAVKKQIYRRKADRVKLLKTGKGHNIDERYLHPDKKLSGEGFLDDLEAKWLGRATHGAEDNFIEVTRDEGEESEGWDTETRREVDQENKRKAKRKANVAAGKQLTAEEITETFDSTKKAIIEKWQEKQLPKLEKRKYGVWVRSRKGKVHDSLGQNNKVLQEIEIRLEKQLENYLVVQYFSVAELQKAIMGNSKQSIIDAEMYTWTNAVIRGKRPEKPSPVTRRVRIAAPPTSQLQVDNDVEGESLDDDSDVENSDGFDDNMDDFIVADDIYDKGHEYLKPHNEAILKTMDTRFEESGITSCDVEMEDVVPHTTTIGAIAPATAADGDVLIPDAQDAEGELVPQGAEGRPTFEDAEGEPVPIAKRKISVEELKSPVKKSKYTWFSNSTSISAVKPTTTSATPPATLSTSPTPTLTVPTSALTIPAPTTAVAPTPQIAMTTTPTCSTSVPRIKKEPDVSSRLISTSTAEIIDLTLDTPESSQQDNRRGEVTISLLDDDTPMILDDGIHVAPDNLEPSSSSRPPLSQRSSNGNSGPKTRPLILDRTKSKDSWEVKIIDLWKTKRADLPRLKELATQASKAKDHFFLNRIGVVQEFLDSRERSKSQRNELGLSKYVHYL